MIWAVHRTVDFADGTAIGAGFLVMIASVVAFNGRGDAALLGPLLVGMSQGLTCRSFVRVRGR
jgi:hypothetical protein